MDKLSKDKTAFGNLAKSTKLNSSGDKMLEELEEFVSTEIASVEDIQQFVMVFPGASTLNQHVYQVIGKTSTFPLTLTRLQFTENIPLSIQDLPTSPEPKILKEEKANKKEGITLDFLLYWAAVFRENNKMALQQSQKIIDLSHKITRTFKEMDELRIGMMESSLKRIDRLQEIVMKPFSFNHTASIETNQTSQGIKAEPCKDSWCQNDEFY